MIVFSPVGHCIYCNTEIGKLGKEHIIPLGLGGHLILPEASCRKCEVITGRFEGTVLRTIYGNFRLRNQLPTRRPKLRPKTLKIKNRAGKKLDVPVEELPHPYFVYTFGECGYLAELPEHVDVSNGSVSTIHNKSEIEDFTKKYDWDQTVDTKYMPNEFRRMILKIGYGMAVAVFGTKVPRYFCVPYILGEKQNISYLVGQNKKQEEFFTDRLHDVGLTLKANVNHVDIISEVRLFAGAGTPTYHAVVGRIDTKFDILDTIKAAGNSDRIQMSSPSGSTITFSKGDDPNLLG